MLHYADLSWFCLTRSVNPTMRHCEILKQSSRPTQVAEKVQFNHLFWVQTFSASFLKFLLKTSSMSHEVRTKSANHWLSHVFTAAVPQKGLTQSAWILSNYWFVLETFHFIQLLVCTLHHMSTFVIHQLSSTCPYFCSVKQQYLTGKLSAYQRLCI